MQLTKSFWRCKEWSSEDGANSDDGDRATPGDDKDSVGDGLIISFLLLDLIIDMFLLIANYLVLSYACKVFLNFKLSLSFRGYLLKIL
jgi:hypothetical protein